ncbi:MAG: hypothetical protein H6560_19580 [Lewinellaceae bacterium]|nr:hypothetical protein [Lewinellaceae bacterium]
MQHFVHFFGFDEAIPRPKANLKVLPILVNQPDQQLPDTSQHGTVLKNDDATLEWQNDGNLVLFYGQKSAMEIKYKWNRENFWSLTVIPGDWRFRTCPET